MIKTPRQPIAKEHDACAIIAFVDKNGRASHAKISKTIEALKEMAHRSGDIFDEGDGCGVLTDIPREVWAARLEERGLSRHLAESRGFFVGHFLLPVSMGQGREAMLERIGGRLAAHGLDVLMDVRGDMRAHELGPRGRAEAPLFWQVAGMTGEQVPSEARRLLFEVELDLEREFPNLHTASLSMDSAAWKVRGTPDLLTRVYPGLMDPLARSVSVLGHSRYSTNTLPTVERSQPFSILAHNGEINTIERLRSAARALGIPTVPGGSDSQDVNRILEGLINSYGFDPLEALAMVFPAVESEVAAYPRDLCEVYAFYRWFFPPSAQGPAAVVARHGQTVMGSVDALGLRPLWFGETDYDYFLSSEKGVVDVASMASDPKPLAPGEKVALYCLQGTRAEVYGYSRLQRRLSLLMDNRKSARNGLSGLYGAIPQLEKGWSAGAEHGLELADLALHFREFPEQDMDSQAMLGAFGWQRYDVDTRKKVSDTGKAVIGSLGHTGPLACLNRDSLPNISEFFKENVAVVTNPAIDREREAAHFSTRVILGDRPGADGGGRHSATGLALKRPILLGGCPAGDLDRETSRVLAADYGTAILEDVLAFFTAEGRDPHRAVVLDATFTPGREALADALDRICLKAEEAVRDGAVIVLVDDSASFAAGRVFIDPGLAVAALQKRLDETRLRRNCSILVRSAAVRNLHDLMFLLGLGADAVNPYLLMRVAVRRAGEGVAPESAIRATMDVLVQGVEKVMSTMGIHELCGYGRIFASVGLAPELAELFQCANFAGSETGGLDFAALEDMAARRLDAYRSGDKAKLFKDAPRNPKVSRIMRAVAVGDKTPEDMSRAMTDMESADPVALRHLLDFEYAPSDRRPDPGDVDISIGRHSMPLVIPAMSFGSQGENSFRTYAEAAKALNILCVNGEGGEIPDMLGKYRANRAQQIASGRFGVFMGFLNSTDFLEIKVGQGAKPGEGGHLPGTKVTDQVARARHCIPGVALISPSNHHDIYSIEDLFQIISELKTANPKARISVKIPITGGVGTIAVGVAKAGADIVNLSGFDGGTGAAREHSKKYVGLPAEIGVSQAHLALEESGLRHMVELWCDGGMRSPADVVKMILLGADRVGLGTLCLMGVGCIGCRKCHLDSCPMGISTQISSQDEARSRGLKKFRPRDVAEETANLSRLLSAVGDEVRAIVAGLGQTRLCDLVGRTDLLRQTERQDSVDVADILESSAPEGGTCEVCYGRALARKPLNYLTKLISDLSLERFRGGAGTVHYKDEGLRSTDRAVGTHLAGAMARELGPDHGRGVELRLGASLPGNGLCAFSDAGITATVEGGAQDGTAKGCFGGRVGVFKGVNLMGGRVDGSTGKSFAYGAIGGTLFVQNYADSRACVRMSGADAVFGARLVEPLQDELGNIASRAHLKGFAFEYMTGGRAVVLGDPGPWMCAGMTGGVVYQCLYPELGLDREALRRRLAPGANVGLRDLDRQGLADVRELLGAYVEHLEKSFQQAEAEAVVALLSRAKERFTAIRPRAMAPHQE